MGGDSNCHDDWSLVEVKNTLAAEKIVILRLVDGGDPCLKEGGA